MIGNIIEDKDLNTLPEYLQWYVMGALEILKNSNDIKFHQHIRQQLFNRAKEYNDDVVKALLTISKFSIEIMGI